MGNARTTHRISIRCIFQDVNLQETYNFPYLSQAAIYCPTQLRTQIIDGGRLLIFLRNQIHCILQDDLQRR